MVRAARAKQWVGEQPAFPPLVEVRPDRRLRFNFHKGQAIAWRADERIVAVVAGTQSGKTTFGPLWLEREIQDSGAGTYLVAAPNYPLLTTKLIPEFRKLFVDQLGLGVFLESPRPRFIMTPEGDRRLWGTEQDERTTVFFGSAEKPSSLESMTAKAAWLDEAGQPEFKVASYEAIMRRVSLAMGRILITTTPYTVGHWLRRRVFDKASPIADGTRRSDIESIRVIQFKSIWNPAFPREEWERAKRDLPRWKFRMMYCGEFSKPAGQIYDIFGQQSLVPRFALPERWPRYGGLDFGGVNTYAVFVAENPESNELYIYKTYRGGNATAATHTSGMLKNEPKIPVFYGGAKSEQQWRDEFKAAGLPVKTPLASEVEIGIDRVYAELAGQSLYVFDDLEDLIDEFENYSRRADDEGNVFDEILNKNDYHGLDATRYIIGSIRGKAKGSTYSRTEPDYSNLGYETAYARNRYER